jgi:hypothetical protein
MPIRAGSTPATAELGRLFRVGDQAHRGAVVLAARVAGGDRRVGVGAEHHRAQLAERLERGVFARVLVGAHDRVAFAPVDRDRDDLLVEEALLLRGHGALVGAQ